MATNVIAFPQPRVKRATVRKGSTVVRRKPVFALNGENFDVTVRKGGKKVTLKPAPVPRANHSTSKPMPCAAGCQKFLARSGASDPPRTAPS